MKDSLNTIIYSLVLGLTCALILTAAAEFARPYKEANQKAEKGRNILAVLGIEFDAKISAQELEKIQQTSVEERGTGRFAYVKDGQVQAVAVEFEGPGLWAGIKGYISLEPDMRTIRGITFTEQEETPGLGGDIVTPGFRNQFKDKKIVGSDGKAGIAITAPGRAEGQNEVDGISGATITCGKVEQMLNKTIEEIVKEK